MSGGSGFRDHFSRQTDAYARFRPGYPHALFGFLADRCTRRGLAWDCACGSGQATRGLLGFFDTVVATDASHAQLASADWPDAVRVWAARGEASGLPGRSVDLITVAQALHWFEREAFFAECRRVLRPGGLVAVWTYGLLRIEPALDAVVDRLYGETLGECWPGERAWVESGYAGMDFPFPVVPAPDFAMQADWNLAQLLGYLRSWSATERYRARHRQDPVELVAGELARHWGEPGAARRIAWPLKLRLGCFHPAGD